mgnify:CR=1 FL=1
MRSTSSRLTSAAVGAVLLLAACGSDDVALIPAADEDAAADATPGAAVELPEPAPGPVPDLPVDPASVSNPLPAVAVRQINGEGGWVQFKNLLPAENPLLVWFWAPH